MQQRLWDGKTATQQIPSKPNYPLVPKGQELMIGDHFAGQVHGSYIYYPHPKKPQYQSIAFADPEAFFAQRKATSAEKCLAATSLFYALRANAISGLLFLVNASHLGTSDKAKGKRVLAHIAHTLQQYFPKATRRRKIERSILVMVIMDNQNSEDEAKRKFKSLIQLFHQAYYSEADHSPKRKALQEKRNKLDQAYADLQVQSKKLVTRLQVILKKSQELLSRNKDIQKEDKNVSEKFRNLLHEHRSNEDDIKNIEAQIKNLLRESNKIKDKIKEINTAIKNLQEAPHILALFFTMLLMQDVPKDQIDNVDNFILDKNRFCYICPSELRSVQEILDKKLTRLKPIPDDTLSLFDNPVSRYIGAKLLYFSIQLTGDAQSLLDVKQEIDTLNNRLSSAQNKLSSEEIAAGDYKKDSDAYKALESKHKKHTAEWKKQRNMQIKKWQGTAHMLQFFAKETLKDGVQVKAIQSGLTHFGKATQLKQFLPAPESKSSHQQDSKPQLPAYRAEEPAASHRQVTSPAGRWTARLVGGALAVGLLLIFLKLWEGSIQELKTILMHNIFGIIPLSKVTIPQKQHKPLKSYKR